MVKKRYIWFQDLRNK